MADGTERERWHRERLPQILTRLDATERDLTALGMADTAMSDALAGRPGPELAGGARTLTLALERTRPPNPRSQIAHLCDEGDSLKRSLAVNGADQDQQAERLERLGLRRLTRAGREEGRRLRAMIERSVKAEERLYAQQAVISRQLQALQPARERWEGFERELAPALRGRVEALEGEIARRVEVRLSKIEREVPAYLTTALGPLPGPGRGQERWCQGAAAIEGYRERHGITDPQRALGPEFEGPLSPSKRRSIERTVEDVRAELSYIARAHERSETERSGRDTPGDRTTALARTSGTDSTTARASAWSDKDAICASSQETTCQPYPQTLPDGATRHRPTGYRLATAALRSATAPGRGSKDAIGAAKDSDLRRFGETSGAGAACAPAVGSSSAPTPGSIATAPC